MLISSPQNFNNNKPILKVDFTDFFGIDKVNNFFSKILREEFNVVISDNPDLLFFSDAGGSSLHKLYTCRKIFWTGESVLPNHNLYDGAIAPLEINSDRHQRMPYYILGTECNQQALIKNNGFANNILNEHRTGCSFMVSNISSKASFRTNFFKELSKKLNIYSGGRALNNIGKEIPPGGIPKFNFLKKYKFNLAMENRSITGYATEKIVEAMWAGTIPIYYGDPLIKEQFNKDSFIDISDFSSINHAIEFILEVDNDFELYKRYLDQPYFIKNTPNKWYDEEVYLKFIKKILNMPKVSTESKLSRHTLAKRMHY